ncbi:MAG TPA: hypothetical protein VGR56_07255, partial [Nitrososphaerales archaeon]|nr:hypothetical protein [Nitrososphaerales archaeon]
MGVGGKLIAIALTLVVSYVFLAVILVTASTFVLDLGLNPYALSVYNLVGNNLLQISSGTAVLVFFTVPALLSVFGRSGPWFRLLSRYSKGLLVTFGSSALIYIGATAAATVQTVPAVYSAGEPIAVIGLVGLLILGVLSHGTLLSLAERLVGAMLRVPSLLSLLVGRQWGITAIELRLTSTKQIREKSEEKVVQEEAIKFERFARALTSMKLTTEFRLSFRERRGRVILLARGRERVSSIEQRLLSIAKTYLPETLPAAASVVADATPQASILLMGAPEPSPNPLEPLARFFIENGFEGDYAVVLRQRKGNPVSSLIDRRKQRELARRAGQQLSSSTLVGEQNTTSVQDHFFAMELEEAIKR